MVYYKGINEATRFDSLNGSNNFVTTVNKPFTIVVRKVYFSNFHAEGLSLNNETTVVTLWCI